jgi:hypothetical protein
MDSLDLGCGFVEGPFERRNKYYFIVQGSEFLV